MHTTSLRISLICTGLLAGIATGAACSRYVTNEEHCFRNGGNAACDERYDGALPYCGTVCLGQDGMEPSPNGDGCVDFVPEDGCYSPCGGKDITEDDSCLDVADTGSSESVGTDPTGTSATDATEGPSTTVTTVSGSETEPTTSGPVGCVESSECTDASAPLCLNELCVGCGESDTPDGSCAEKDPGLGVCGNDGACVECTVSNADACSGTTPVCDGESSACVGCEAHDECGGAACAFATGECLDACVLEVGGGGEDAADVQGAVAMVSDGEACTIVVYGEVTDPYVGTVTIDGGKVIGLLAAEGESPVVQGNIGPGIDLSGGAVLYADRLQLRGHTSGLGLRLDGAGTEAWVDRCEIAQNADGGITVQDSATLHLRNSMVGGDGDTPAVAVNGAQADILYTTSLGYLGASPALACTGPVTVTVRNSIVASRADAADDIDCDDAAMSYTATEVLVPGTGNVAIGPMTPTETMNWFGDYGEGDFSLQPAGATVFADIAQWQSGDPATDIDGQDRPAVDGTPDYAGADVP